MSFTSTILSVWMGSRASSRFLSDFVIEGWNTTRIETD